MNENIITEIANELKITKKQVEVVIVINALDIQKNKIRSDLGINYESEVLRLIDAFRSTSLFVGSVCINQYQSTPQVDTF